MSLPTVWTDVESPIGQTLGFSEPPEGAPSKTDIDNAVGITIRGACSDRTPLGKKGQTIWYKATAHAP